MSEPDIGYARIEGGLDWQHIDGQMQFEAEVKIGHGDDDAWVLLDQAWTQLSFYARQPDES